MISTLIPTQWHLLLKEELKQPYFKALSEFVTFEYENHLCFPPKEKLFDALKYCDFENLKVVIIGQDPYHDVGQANGLCFSVNKGVSLPPSLVNIFKELERDTGKKTPPSGDLSHWAKQGVLLLNATLSVRAHQADSHKNKGWEKFTDAIIKKIANEKSGIIFMLWGGKAKQKAKLINSNHHILTSGHPSPLSANRGYWFGNKHFSTTNNILAQTGKKKIDW